MHCVIKPNWKHKKVWHLDLCERLCLGGFTPSCLSKSRSWNNPERSKPSTLKPSAPLYVVQESSKNYTEHSLLMCCKKTKKTHAVSSLQEMTRIQRYVIETRAEEGLYFVFYHVMLDSTDLCQSPRSVHQLCPNNPQPTHSLCLGAMTRAGGGGREARVWVISAWTKKLPLSTLQ